VEHGFLISNVDHSESLASGRRRAWGWQKKLAEFGLARKTIVFALRFPGRSSDTETGGRPTASGLPLCTQLASFRAVQADSP